LVGSSIGIGLGRVGMFGTRLCRRVFVESSLVHGGVVLGCCLLRILGALRVAYLDLGAVLAVSVVLG